MRRRFIFGMLCLATVLVTAPLQAADAPATTAAREGGAEGKSLSEINKDLSNPISSTWSIGFQQNNYMLDMGPGQPAHWNSNLNFQPLLQVSLTEDWGLVTRPVITLFNSAPHLSSYNPEEINRTTGFGDTIITEMLVPSPRLTSNWLLGAGPTFILPTASSKFTGHGKYQVGPAAVVGYLSKKWILAAFVQNWQSFAGSGNRPDINQMNLQPIAVYFLPGGWGIGYSGNILANWKADSARNTWTVPLGLGVSKVLMVGKLPVKIGLAGQYMVHHPEIGGQKWNIQLNVVPVIPMLIKGSLIK